MGPDAETIVRVLQIPAIGTDVHADFALSPSDENAGDTGGRISELAEASRGMCHYNDGVGSLLKHISCEESLEGHSAWGFHHS